MHWNHCLDAAQVHDPGLRTDYTLVARYFRARERAGYWLIRTLTPPHYQPHLVVGAALGHLTNDVSDRGTPAERTEHLATWALRLRHAQAARQSDHPLLRAALSSGHRCDRPILDWAETHADGARLDATFTGFDTEADYQHYVDAVTWPGLMASFGLAPLSVTDAEFAASCRVLADAVQRADILIDLADDLTAGRLRFPDTTMEQYGVTRTDLLNRRDTPGVHALLASTGERARADLRTADRVHTEVATEFAPPLRCFLALYHHRLDTAAAMKADLTRRTVRDRPLAVLRILAEVW